MMPTRYLLDAEGRAAIDRLLARRPLLGFDFDGTLAPIVMHPDEARIPEHTARLLEQLAARLPVAVVSGRQVLDVRHRLGFKPTHIVGNHGAEDEFDGPDPRVVATLAAFRERAKRMEPALNAAGATIEDKGASIAIHYRMAPNPALAREAIDALMRDLPPGIDTEPGKRVVNVLAAGAPDKGQALLRLAARYGTDAGFYIGDDTNDEPAFERAHDTWVTVRVGPRLDHSHARYYLNEQAEIDDVLRLMLDRIG
ncbi:trehalose-phosphatase [Mitsuaria sp. GD03876]|uniref:trehalose-phosphatase n=1 Tax=Mitsuaria sp. GD03876 TaxID=2975399 RepID=UPI002447DFB2|nr:trehalose-phosphatase [Mitsuaria sp. GD03876]MDH0866093.1 trehalose-phosphatase [Mitsuaria sp. GD03876]